MIRLSSTNEDVPGSIPDPVVGLFSSGELGVSVFHYPLSMFCAMLP